MWASKSMQIYVQTNNAFQLQKSSVWINYFPIPIVRYRFCHTRELAIVQMEEPELQQFLPQTYHSISSISKVNELLIPLWQNVCSFVLRYFLRNYITYKNFVVC